MKYTRFRMGEILADQCAVSESRREWISSGEASLLLLTTTYITIYNYYYRTMVIKVLELGHGRIEKVILGRECSIGKLLLLGRVMRPKACVL
jgi:hypothetical protein